MWTGSWGGAFWSLTKGEGGAQGEAPADQEKTESFPWLTWEAKTLAPTWYQFLHSE